MTMTVEKGQTWVRKPHTYPAGAVEVLGVTDTHVEFTPAGGGFVYRGPIEAFVGQHVLRAADALDPPWIAAWFALDDAGPWPGYWQGFRWNGWATPEFERDTMRTILDDVEVEWTAQGDDFVLTGTISGDDDHPERLEPHAVTVDGVTKQLYAFDGWCFHVAAAPEAPTQWRCKGCGRPGTEETCAVCGGTLAQLPEEEG